MGIKAVIPFLLCGVAFMLLLSDVTGQSQSQEESKGREGAKEEGGRRRGGGKRQGGGKGGAKTFTAVGVPPEDKGLVGNSALLVVKFGNKQIVPEKVIPQSEVAKQPSVQFSGAKDLTQYTLFIINLDVNNTHWLVANIPGELLRKGVSPKPGTTNEGDTLFAYQAPNPTDNKQHRYFCLVFQQTDVSNSIGIPPSRTQNFPQFVSLNNLLTPQAAGNTFLLEGSGKTGGSGKKGK